MSESKALNHLIDTWIAANPRKLNESGYYAKIADKFNVHPERARKRWRMFAASLAKANETIKHEPIRTIGYHQVIEPASTSVGSYTYTTTHTGANVVGETEKEIKTLEDLIQLCEIDTDTYEISGYEIKSYNAWVKKPKNHGIKPGESSIEQKKLFSFKAILKIKKVDTNLDGQKDLILEEIKAASLSYKPNVPEIEIAPFVSLNIQERQLKNHALEINIPDLHIGKLAWGKETGEDYDINIAIARYSKAIRSLVARVNPHILEKIILPVGNDLINVDNSGNTTTAGTHVSCDSRFGKMFQAAKNLLIGTIDFLSHIAPVYVEIIPGNHDSIATFTLGEVLDAWYHNNDKVTVSNTHTPRKYIQYGKNLIMYTHGHREKLNDLPIICATEQPQLWANTLYRRVHIGHFHHSKQVKFVDVQELPGVTVKILNSLSSNDAWHAEKGYLSLKGAEAFLYDKDKGLVANYYYLNN